MSAGAGVQTPALRVGGGLAASDVACRLQADVLGIPVLRSTFRETTAWGAALLAGLGVGTWPTVDALPPLPGIVSRFEPRWNDARRAAALLGRTVADPSRVRAGRLSEAEARKRLALIRASLRGMI